MAPRCFENTEAPYKPPTYPYMPLAVLSVVPVAFGTIGVLSLMVRNHDTTTMSKRELRAYHKQVAARRELKVLAFAFAGTLTCISAALSLITILR